MTPWGSGRPLHARTRTDSLGRRWSRAFTCCRLPLKLASSSSLRCASTTSEMFLAFSQAASCRPTLTSSDRVLSDAAVNNATITTARLVRINLKSLNIWNFGRGFVIVVNSGTRSLTARERCRRELLVSDACWTERGTAHVRLFFIFFKFAFISNKVWTLNFRHF